jgi:hypothetical protein
MQSCQFIRAAIGNSPPIEAIVCQADEVMLITPAPVFLAACGQQIAVSSTDLFAPPL